MLARSPTVSKTEFEETTGWTFKPEGACKGQVCIPLSAPVGDSVDLVAMAGEMGLPVVSEPELGYWAVGPESVGARALTSAQAPSLVLPDLDGNAFDLASLRGKRVLLYAWAPY